MGKSSINWQFSMVMLNNQRVHEKSKELIRNYLFRALPQNSGYGNHKKRRYQWAMEPPFSLGSASPKFDQSLRDIDFACFCFARRVIRALFVRHLNSR